jgi:N-acetylglutamate synthase-like GNAT family acetyltransferase
MSDKGLWQRDGFIISTDPARIQLDTVHRFLSTESYWAGGVSREVVERSITNSLPFGVYVEATGEQIGFARVITDKATFAYLSDVFIVPEYRGRGLSKWLVEVILSHPELQGLRRWLLLTADAHGLYAPFGFTPVPEPSRLMQIHNPTVYQSSDTKTL